MYNINVKKLTKSITSVPTEIVWIYTPSLNDC